MSSNNNHQNKFQLLSIIILLSLILHDSSIKFCQAGEIAGFYQGDQAIESNDRNGKILIALNTSNSFKLPGKSVEITKALFLFLFSNKHYFILTYGWITDNKHLILYTNKTTALDNIPNSWNLTNLISNSDSKKDIFSSVQLDQKYNFSIRDSQKLSKACVYSVFDLNVLYTKKKMKTLFSNLFPSANEQQQDSSLKAIKQNDLSKTKTDYDIFINGILWEDYRKYQSNQQKNKSKLNFFTNCNLFCDFIDPTLKQCVPDKNRPNKVIIKAKYLRKQLFIRKANRYAQITVGLNMIQIYFLYKQIHFSSTTARAQKLSVWSFVMMAYYDSYLVVIHSYLATSNANLFNSFIILAITQFIIFSIFEMKIMLLITRASNPEAFQGNQESIRRQLGGWYLKFYIVLILSIVTVYLQRLYLFAPIFMSFQIPQIIFNVQKRVDSGLLHDFVIVTSIVKMFFVGYYYGCPEQTIFSGISKPATNYKYLIAIQSWLQFQVLLLLSMDIQGPRFFIPLKWQPDVYDYYRQIENQDLEESGECAICFSLLNEPTEIQSPTPNSDTSRRNICSNNTSLPSIMVTPCEHYFHEQCLTRQMEQQMKCPTCRGALPPP